MPRRNPIVDWNKWSHEEDERLRAAYHVLLNSMSGRTEAGVFARINSLRIKNYQDWKKRTE